MSQLPSTAEQAYLDALEKLTGQEKVRRGFKITFSVFNMIALQIKAQFPDIDDRELRLRVAERAYMAEPEITFPTSYEDVAHSCDGKGLLSQGKSNHVPLPL